MNGDLTAGLVDEDRREQCGELVVDRVVGPSRVDGPHPVKLGERRWNREYRHVFRKHLDFALKSFV